MTVLWMEVFQIFCTNRDLGVDKRKLNDPAETVHRSTWIARISPCLQAKSAIIRFPGSRRCRFSEPSGAFHGAEDEYTDICAKMPLSRKPYGPAERHLMQPYGCTTLRMTEMPMPSKR